MSEEDMEQHLREAATTIDEIKDRLGNVKSRLDNLVKSLEEEQSKTDATQEDWGNEWQGA